MQTISAEEFKKKYGEQALAQFPSTSTQSRPTISQTIGNAFKGAVSQIGQGFQQIGQGGTNPASAVGNLITGVGKVGAGAIGAAFSPLAPITEPLISKPLQSVADKLAENPTLQKFATSKAGQAVSNVAENVANYANIAGAVGGAMEVPKVGSAIKTGASNVVSEASNAFDSVVSKVSEYPKILADKITSGKIEPKVQTILKESPASTFDMYVKQGEQALTDPRTITPLELAGQAGEEVAKVMKKDLNTIGQEKTAALESVKDTRAPNIAVDQIEKAKPLLQKKLTDPERSAVNELITELKSLGKNPTVGSVDATIDKLQAILYEKSKGVAIPMTTRVQSFINSSIGELNGKLKAAVDAALGNDSYSVLNAKYSQTISKFQQLNKALGEGGTKGGSLMKRFFSPQDAGTKELFAYIKDNYGVDLGANATLAKFVMDTLGDTRAKSLLQLPPRSAIGVVGEVLNQVEKKLTSPKQIIKKARTMTKQ